MQIIGETKIFKDERGVYKLAIANKEINPETNEEEVNFMRINVGFKKGLPEVKNQAKINIVNGFLTFYKIKTNEVNEEGNPIYKNFPKIMITDLEILEEGTDEVLKYREPKTENTVSQTTYPEYDDDLPF